jgi:hypothetical protein
MRVDSETSVSLLEHLHTDLLPLLSIESLPSPLSAEISDYVKPSFSQSAEEIPYDSLLRVSRWASTVAGKIALTESSLGAVSAFATYLHGV